MFYALLTTNAIIWGLVILQEVKIQKIRKEKGELCSNF
jgi:hypothetical protein